jgi:hypothetical protein
MKNENKYLHPQLKSNPHHPHPLLHHLPPTLSEMAWHWFKLKSNWEPDFGVFLRGNKQQTRNTLPRGGSMSRNLRKGGRHTRLPPNLSEIAWHWFKPQPEHNLRPQWTNGTEQTNWCDRWQRRQRWWAWLWTIVKSWASDEGCCVLYYF